MISFIISFVAALATSTTLVFKWPGHPVMTTIASILAFFIVLLLINLALKKKLEAAFATVQQLITDKQAVLMRKIKTVGMRATPQFQKEIEREQADAIRAAIEQLKVLKPFEKWNFMVKRQADTMRAQFYFQLKEYEEADKYFKRALLFDPMIVAMQMTRFYKLGKDKELESCFKKGVRRFRDEKGAIIYALYSWILVQQNKIDDAIQILVQAKTKAENPTLQQNWNYLVNGQVKRFSNAAFGDQWYSLYLETPRMQRIQQQPGGAFGGGRRHY